MSALAGGEGLQEAPLGVERNSIGAVAESVPGASRARPKVARQDSSASPFAGGALSVASALSQTLIAQRKWRH